MQYFEAGNYQMADSLLTKQILLFPNDINAIFNRGVARLSLGDTCLFCKDVFRINDPIDRDDQAVALYLAYCCDADTIFYNKKFEAIDKGRIKYYEVVLNNYCTNDITGKWYFSKGSIKAADISKQLTIDAFETSCFGSYEVDSSGSEIFYFVDTKPRFKKVGLTLEKAVKQNKYYEKLKSDMNETDSLFHIRFIVDENGRAHSPKVYNFVYEGIMYEPFQVKNPSPYFDSVIETLPDLVPAKLHNIKPVSSWVSTPFVF
jgi:hypothetical protein